MEDQNAVQKAVLVTGCSSGIGRAIAMRLAARGWIVFATVRRADQAEELRSSGLPSLVPIENAELSLPEGARRVVDDVQTEIQRRRLSGLSAFVHAAGGGQLAPVELLDTDALRRELEVRLVAPISLLQRLLPSIRQSNGRVVFIATPSLMPMAFNLPIHGSDFFLNCLARTLAQETQSFGLPITLVRCGGIRTPSSERAMNALFEEMPKWPKDVAPLYARSIERLKRELAVFDTKRTPPEHVAEVVEGALLARRPPRRIQVGHMSLAALALECLPQGLQDLLLQRRASVGSE